MPARPRSLDGSCRRIRLAAPERWFQARTVRAPSAPLPLPLSAELRAPPAACAKSYPQQPQRVHLGWFLILRSNSETRIPGRLEFFSRLLNGNRPIHRRQPDHRRRVPIFDASMLVVPDLAPIVAHPRLATYRRVIRRFHHEAVLIPAWHHQPQWTVLRII